MKTTRQEPEHKTKRLTPLGDLLAYCHNPQHKLDTGRTLASFLLGHEADPSGRDDTALIYALERFLWEEMQRLRGEQVMQFPAIPDRVNGPIRLKQDSEFGHSTLTSLSLLWAYHIDKLDRETVAKNVDRAGRTFYDWHDKAVAEVETLIGRKASQQTSNGASGTGRQHVPPEETHTSQPNPSAQATTSNTAPSHVRQSYIADTMFTGDRVQVTLVSPALPPQPVPQSKTQQGYSRDSDRLQSALFLLFIVVVMWITLSTPQVSVYVMLLLSGWRTGRYAQRTMREWRQKRSEELGWNLFAMTPWLTLFGLSLSQALYLPQILDSLPYTSARLGLMLRVVCIAGGMLLLGVMDTLFWIDQGAPAWGPWRQFKRHAAWAYQQRWEVVGLGWFIIAVLGLTLVLTSGF